MNNLIQNDEIILNTLQKTCSHIESLEQIRKPTLSNIELIALNLTAEHMSYDTELQLLMAIKGCYLECKIERSVQQTQTKTFLLSGRNPKMSISAIHRDEPSVYC